MAQATDTQLGEIILDGDLAGDGGPQVGSNPQLTHILTGKEGNYPLANITVGSDGRITDISNASAASITGMVPSASASEAGVVKIGDNLLVSGSAVAAYWDIDFGGSVSGGGSTGFDSCAHYTFTIEVDGTAVQNIDIVGGDAATFTALVNELTSAISGATASINSGNIRITSDTAASGSSIVINNDQMFSCASGYVSLGSQTAGGGPCELSVPEATALVAGVVQIGSGINVSNGVISIPPGSLTPATTTTLGGVIVPSSGNLDVDGSGNISVPIATTSTVGVFSVGSGLTINGSGVLSFNAGSYTPSDATTSSKGVVQIGDHLNESLGAAWISVDKANSTSTYGVVRSADTTNISISSGQIDVGTNVGQKDTTGTWTAAQNVASVALSFGTTTNTNAALGNVFTATATSNFTLANPTNLVAGGFYTWILTQDGTGSRVITYGSNFKFAAGADSTLSTTGGDVDIISGVYDGTNIYCGLAKGF